MKDDREVTAEALQRAQGLRLRKEKQKRTWHSIAAVAACAVLIAGLSFALPSVSPLAQQPGASGIYTASLFAGGGAGGYVLIGVIAFALGALVAFLLFRKKK